MKKIKEVYITKQRENPQFEIPDKIQNMTYMTFVTRY